MLDTDESTSSRVGWTSLTAANSWCTILRSMCSHPGVAEHSEATGPNSVNPYAFTTGQEKKCLNLSLRSSSKKLPLQTTSSGRYCEHSEYCAKTSMISDRAHRIHGCRSMRIRLAWRIELSSN